MWKWEDTAGMQKATQHLAQGRTGRELQEQAKAAGWGKLGEGGSDGGFGWLECDEKHLDGWVVTEEMSTT